MPISSLSLTKAQALALWARVEAYLATNRLDSVRLEGLRDAWLRVVFIGPEGEPAEDQLIAPA